MGVEITEDAQTIQAHPFSGPTAFMLGNEVRTWAINSNAIAICVAFKQDKNRAAANQLLLMSKSTLVGNLTSGTCIAHSRLKHLVSCKSSAMHTNFLQMQPFSWLIGPSSQVLQSHHINAVQQHVTRPPCCMQGSGLSPQQAQLCDAFVYIPQYGAGTASLNVTVAASIVLQHFAVWAGYPERPRTGEKFEVGERPQRTGPRGAVSVALF